MRITHSEGRGWHITVRNFGIAVTLCGGMTLTACKSITDVLNVPPPAGVETSDALKSRGGAESSFNAAKAGAFGAIAGTNNFVWTGGLLSDEFTFACAEYGGCSSSASVDARRTISDIGSGGLPAIQPALAARSQLLLAAVGLERYEPASERWRVGEAYALVGYIELFLAETYCAGVTLSRALPDGGWEYGMPLTTDSLLATAEAHFDSALVAADTNAMVQGLASIGLGRARMDRGHFAEAASAVAGVTVAFVYNVETSPDGSTGPRNLYRDATIFCSAVNVADHEGAYGLDYRSAHDPRLVLDTTSGQTCDRYGANDSTSVMYYPIKFGMVSTTIPIASGIEAQLMAAEVALRTNDATWLDKINTLRTTCSATIACPSPAPAGTGGVAGLPPLADPGTPEGRVDLLFRERAFWLFGVGTRLGDLRRLVRQYGRSADTVFPIGSYPYANAPGLLMPLPTYGTDVNVALPPQNSNPSNGYHTTNPHYRGCISSTTSA